MVTTFAFYLPGKISTVSEVAGTVTEKLFPNPSIVLTAGPEAAQAPFNPKLARPKS
jgi:hypothetical protein